MLVEVLSVCKEDLWGPFYKYKLTLIPAWISNHIHYQVWDEITYPFRNLNDCTIEVLEWISNFIPQLTGHVITFFMLGLELNHVSKSMLGFKFNLSVKETHGRFKNAYQL